MTAIVRHTDVLGGGIVGGLPPLIPFWGWRTYAVAATYTDPDGVELPAFKLVKASGPVTDTMAQNTARTGDLYVESFWPYGNAHIRGSFPSLAWYLLDPTTLALVAGPLLPLGNAATSLLPQSIRDITPATEHYVQWFDHSTPIVGPYIAVQVSRDPSERFPVFVSGHPVEIAERLLTDQGETYDATSAADAIAALGPDLGHTIAVMSPDGTPQETLDRLSEAYGFAIRRDATTGEVEFVVWLEKLNGLPATVIGMNEIRTEGGPTFDLADQTRITRVRVSGEVVQLWSGQPWVTKTERVGRKLFGEFGGRGTWTREVKRLVPSTEIPASRLAIHTADITFDYSTDGVTPDSDIYGVQEAHIDLAGMPGILDADGGVHPVNLEQWAEGRARLLLDSHARGRQMATIAGIRGTDCDDALLGEAVTLDLDHLPNAQLGQAPTSQRGGQRPFRVIERTEEPSGPVLVMADEGTGVQYGTDPVLTVAPDQSFGSSGLYLVTVAPAATFATDGAQIEFQVRAFAPGEAVDLTDPGFRYTVQDSTLWTDDPHALKVGPFPNGYTIYLRARAWLLGGAASDWSPWTGVGGEVTGPQTTLSDLAISAITDDGATLTWSYDESPQVGDVLVQYRETLVGGAWTTFATLPPGTETDDLTGLDPDTAYDVKIVLDNGGEYGDELLGQFHTLVGAISALVTGTPTSASVALSWTNTDSANLVRVQLKLDTESDYATVIDLPAGSTGYTLTGLVAETDYDVRVVLVNGGAEIGTALTDSFLTDLAANQTTLDAPTNAAVFEGWNPVSGTAQPGMYGLQVIAVFGPPDMQIVFEEAVESAVGSGIPGTYANAAILPAVVGDVTRFTSTAPNDGKLRYLRAYAAATGYTDSATTTALEADPWPSTPTVPDAPSLTIGGMVPTHILSGESFTVPVRRQALFTVPIDNEGVLLVDGVLEAVD
jgi:hypothetical protein